MVATHPTLGSFRLLRELGRGGMAEVWLGRDARGQTAALKLLHAPGVAADGRLDEALQREIQAVARLDHPHIVSLFDFGTATAAEAAQVDGWVEGSTWFAMEHAAGGTLTPDRISRWSDLRRYLLEVLEALGHAHARDIVHRDLKPDNVLLAIDDAGARTVRLTDFGIAYAVDHTLTVDTRRIAARAAGTPYTMAPEQVLGRWRDYGPWTDLYALGITAWEWATGSPPFVANSAIALARAHLVEPVPAFVPRFPVPPGFEAWLRQLLAKRVSRRFQLAPDAAGGLHALPPLREEDLAIVAAPTTPVGARITMLPRETWVGATTPERPPLLDRPRTSREDAVSDGRAERPSFPPHWLESARTEGVRPSAISTRALREPRLAGRVPERDRLWGLLGEVHATGTPRIAVVRGAAGIGKTRLVRWLVERALEVGAAWNLCVRHTAVPGALDGLSPAIQRLFVCGGLTGEPLRERLRAILRVRGATEDEAVTRDADLIAGLIGGGNQQARVGQGALARLFAVIAKQRPAVIWIDDAQWAAEALAFAETLLAEQAGVLLVFTVRDEALVSRPIENAVLQMLQARADACVLRLGPFDADAATEMVGAIAPLDRATSARVAARAEGNPLVAVQLIEHGLASGALEERDGLLHASPDATDALPATTRALWAARVAQVVDGRPLPGAARVQLELAAFLGRVVSHDEWHAAVEASGLTFDPGLPTALERARLATSNRDELAFVHGLLREHVVRNAEEAGRAADWHRACATAIAHCHGAARRTAQRRGEHLRRAGALEEAVGWLVEGLRHLTATSQPAIAIAEVEQLRGAFAALPDGPRARAMLELDVAEIRNRYAVGELDEAFACARRASANAAGLDAPGLQAEAWIWRGRIREANGAADEALAAYHQARTIAERAGDRRQIVRSRAGIATLSFRRGRLVETLAEADATLALGYTGYEIAGLRRAKISALIGLGRHAEARAEADALFDELGDAIDHQYTIGALHNELAELARREGRLDEALQRLSDASEVFVGLMSRDRWTAQLNTGLVLVDAQRPAEAKAVFRAVVPPFDEANMRFHAAIARLGWTRAALATGEALDTVAPTCRRGLDEGVASGFADPDFAALLEWVGGRLAAERDAHRALGLEALAAAAAQWAQLDDAAAVARVQAVIAAARQPR